MRQHDFLKALSASCLAVALFSHTASATVQAASDIVLVPYANSSAESPAAFGVSYSTIATVCASLVYIAPEDKQLFATALSAQTAGIHVSIKYEDSAATVTYPTGSAWSGSVLHCKLLAIWENKTSY